MGTQAEEQATTRKSTEFHNENDSTERLEEDVCEENICSNERDANDKAEARKGLTSEERVLLREKKRQRLAKEQESADTKTSTQEKASHPNPFDDDDENDEEEMGANDINHSNNVQETRFD